MLDAKYKMELLIRNGVFAYDYYECELPAFQRICFYGDESAVDTAIKVAQENGLEISSVQLFWQFYSNKRATRPHWEIAFYP